tara:strand:- start:1834 stop:2973 length:1140 start_codon:yes stop_codon:yes gene_type:complete
MSNFKIKKDKKIRIKQNQIKNHSTLDKKHQENCKKFKKNSSQLDKLQIELKILNDELLSLNFSVSFNSTNINKKQKIILKIDKIEDKIISLQSQDRMEYYNKAGDIIYNYYNHRDNENDKKKIGVSILDLMNKKKKKEIKDNTIINKSSLFNDFCHRVEGIRIREDDGKNRIIYCKQCKIEKILDLHNSAYVCNECGDSENIIMDETIKEYSCYKRLSHFKEWLNQFQAKETTDINDGIYELIVKEIKKSRIKDPKKLNRERMQKILFKLGHSNLYEHIPYIINKLSGIPPPKISADMEKKFCSMFMMIQQPWELYKPKNRKNIISYSYIIYKFCELLELDHLLPYFPLLKSHKKLMEHDIFWKKCCKHLRWEFYPTPI